MLKECSIGYSDTARIIFVGRMLGRDYDFAKILEMEKAGNYSVFITDDESDIPEGAHIFIRYRDHCHIYTDEGITRIDGARWNQIWVCVKNGFPQKIILYSHNGYFESPL